MGQIASILASHELPGASKLEHFGIRRGLFGFTIRYRQLTFTLDRRNFLVCARALRNLDREQLTTFPYSATAFREVINDQRLDATFPGTGRANWCGIGALTRIHYRGMTLKLRSSELHRLLAQFEFRRCKVTDILKQIARRLLGRPNPPDNPLLKQRFSVDLCENIHVHFQNFRLEFSQEEFLALWDCVQRIDPARLESRRIGWLCRTALPATTEWDRRVQLEEQVEGHYHLHYRNLRIEFRDFTEVGVALGAANPLQIDARYMARFVRAHSWKLAGIQTRTLGELQALVFTPAGLSAVALAQSPIYQSLIAQDRTIYENYRTIVLSHDPECDYDWEHFQKLWRDIRDHGFDARYPLVTQGPDHHLADGQHRASILLHLLGPDATVKVVHYA